MCGRYFLSKSFKELVTRYKIFQPQTVPNISFGSEIYPSQLAPVVVKNKKKELVFMNWGFSPSFSDKLLINARGETVEKKPTFKNSFYYKRCLVPAEAYFEWERKNVIETGNDIKKIKRKIKPVEREIFSMAGIYQEFIATDDTPYFAFSILTVASTGKLKKIHHRMPVILNEKEENIWLDSGINDFKVLKQVIKPYQSELLIVDNID